MTGQGGPSPIEDYAGVQEVLDALARGIRVKRKIKLLPTSKSYGMVAADDVIALADMPSSPISHMDGYAVIADDLRSAGASHPIELVVKRDARPGEAIAGAILHGEAVKVATGAPLPAGADAVIPVEEVMDSGRRIVVRTSTEPGSFVYPRGEDVEKGDVVLRRGSPVRAQDVGVLLALGMERVRVYSRPRVAVLATGSELTDGKPAKGKVRNSHSPVFLRLAEALGCTPVDLGVVEDKPLLVSEKIELALRKADFVMTLGGTSVGERDVVGKAVASLNPEAEFHGVRMDRGRVAGAAIVKGKAVLMAPGPIQGAMNAFVLIALPTVGVLSGSTRDPMKLDCVLGSDWAARKRFSNFTKVVYVSFKEGWEVADPVIGDTESISMLSKADGYIVVPEDVSSLTKGSRVQVNILQGFSFV